MKILSRVSKLITANINHLLDQAEDPEVMVKEIIREMEESIIEMRRETVRAVAREKQLQKQIQTAHDLALDLEEKAKLALSKGDENLARQILGKKLYTEKTRGNLEAELKVAIQSAQEMKADLARLEDQAQVARRKKDELIRRKQAAQGQMRSHEAARRSAEAITAVSGAITTYSTSSLVKYEDAIVRMESEAEAVKEVLSTAIQAELDLQKLAEENRIEEELQRLKREQQEG
jgi:phage shock protein A